jgi:hypothetical protein
MGIQETPRSRDGPSRRRRTFLRYGKRRSVVTTVGQRLSRRAGDSFAELSSSGKCVRGRAATGESY